MKVGDTVVIERDETLYPPKGTWPEYRGRKGRIATVNRGRTMMVVGRPKGMSKKQPAFSREVKILTEYGVSFTRSDHVDAWFQAYELRVK